MKLRAIRYAAFSLATSSLIACGVATAAEVPAPVVVPIPPPPAPIVAAPAPAPSMFDLQITSLRNYVSAFNRHDAAAIAALYDPEAIFMERGEFASVGEAITANYQRYFDAFPDCTTSISRSWHKGDLVVFEYAEGGTNAGPHGSNKPMGKKVGYVGASLLQLNAKGLVKKDSTYYDQLTMEVQAGWAKGPLAKLPVRPVLTVPQATTTWEVHQVTSKDVGQPKLFALSKSLYSSFQMRSKDEYLAPLSDTVVIAAYDDPTDAVGKAAAGRLFDEWRKTFSAGTVNGEEGWEVDGHVVILGTFAGTHVGAWGPLKATKKPFTSHFIDIARVGPGDKVERIWTYANNYEILRDLGYEQE